MKFYKQLSVVSRKAEDVNPTGGPGHCSQFWMESVLPISLFLCICYFGYFTFCALSLEYDLSITARTLVFLFTMSHSVNFKEKLMEEPPPHKFYNIHISYRRIPIQRVAFLMFLLNEHSFSETLWMGIYVFLLTVFLSQYRIVEIEFENCQKKGVCAVINANILNKTIGK